MTTLDRELSMLHYSNKIPNDSWLPFLNSFQIIVLNSFHNKYAERSEAFSLLQEKQNFKNRELRVLWIVFVNCRGMILNRWVWHVLSIMNCLSTDTLVDLHLLAILKLSYLEDNFIFGRGKCPLSMSWM